MRLWLLYLTASISTISSIKLNRRLALSLSSSATASLLSPPARAAEEGGVQWSLDLPASFDVSRRLASIVRVRVETVLAAEEPNGVQARVLLIPFGQQAAGSFDADEQLALANYFLGDASKRQASDAIKLASVMSTSAGRSRGVLKMQPMVAATRAYSKGGREFINYQYEVDKCVGEVDDGECLGSVSRRHNLAAVTISSISQYRTNTERQRMAEMGQSRNVDVLWLLTLSAPAAQWTPALEARLQAVANSFEIPFSSA